MISDESDRLEWRWFEGDNGPANTVKPSLKTSPQHPNAPARARWSKLLIAAGAGVVAISPALIGALPLLALGSIPVVLSFLAVVRLAYLAFERSARQELWRNILISLVAGAFMLTAADLLFRPIMRPPWYTVRWPRFEVILRFPPNYHSTTRIEGHGALAKDGRDIVFQTDAHGFRNEVADPSAIDLLVLGDSFAAGISTTQSEIWPRLLARRTGLSVYNLAVEGMNPWQELVTLLVERDRLELHSESRLLWMLFGANDLDGVFQPRYTLEELPLNNALEAAWVRFMSFRHQSPLASRVRFWQARNQSHSLVRRFLDGSGVSFFTPYAKRVDWTAADVRRHPHFPYLRTTIRALKQTLRRERVGLTIISAPSKAEVYAWVLNGGPPWSTKSARSAFSSAVAELAAREELPFVDLQPALIDASRRVFERSGQLLYWRDDTHWNLQGHRLVAEILIDRLGLARKLGPRTSSQFSIRGPRAASAGPGSSRPARGEARLAGATPKVGS